MKELLEKLDFYRKFPRFQLERHFDVILLKYIPTIINHFYSKNYEIVFPEFPVKKKLLDPSNKSEMESVAFDYVLFSKNDKERRIGIVELKTEIDSNRTKQDVYLKKLETNIKGQKLIDFITERKDYQPRTKITKKYKYLYSQLEENDLLNNIESKIEVYKISPTNDKLDNESYISFKKIGSEITDIDKQWVLIKEYLLDWDEEL